METVMTLRPEEFTDDFIAQLKEMVLNAKRVEIHLDGVDATNNLPIDQIANRLQKLSENKTVSFSFNEFESYTNKLVG